MSSSSNIPHIVVIGGGAGGLELATRLGRQLGRTKKAKVTLVDKQRTHVWKPLWHEVAAGTLTTSQDEIDYSVQGYNNYFAFQLGQWIGLDKSQKEIILSEVKNNDGYTILPRRTIAYTLLIIAIGSITYDFNIPGVKEHCHTLNSYEECKQFQQNWLEKLYQLETGLIPFLNITIVGGGATGVELAAELQFACEQALRYTNNMDKIKNFKINIVESAPTILSALPSRLASNIREKLQAQGIAIYENEKVSEITEDTVFTEQGIALPSDIKLWAAGIRAPEILPSLKLLTNPRNQLIVRSTLQTVEEEEIFAFGDCAYCPQAGETSSVPPRAQAAQQQAKLLIKTIKLKLKNKPLPSYHYRDYGSLISLSKKNTLGNLSNNLLGSIMLEGVLAKLTYRFLYRRHQAALLGWFRVYLITLSELLSRVVRSQLKLH